MTEYPYMTSNNKISMIIESLQSAAKPAKFTLDFLRNMGYTSTNDRGIVPLFKKLRFLTDDSVPTVYYMTSCVIKQPTRRSSLHVFVNYIPNYLL